MEPSLLVNVLQGLIIVVFILIYRDAYILKHTIEEISSYIHAYYIL